MSAQSRLADIERQEKVRSSLLAKEKARAAEEQRIRQEADKSAWLRELEEAGACVSRLLRCLENEN